MDEVRIRLYVDEVRIQGRGWVDALCRGSLDTFREEQTHMRKGTK